MIVSIIAIVAWGTTYGWHFNPLSPYQLFPLLGLMAFSIMWSHYVVGTIRELTGLDQKAFSSYFRLTGYAVLTLICLHPGILIFKRLRDGYGLPPSSYLTYVAPGLRWVVLLGTVSFLIFIAYELKRWFGDRTWWHFIAEAGDFAMLAIMYHGFRLGGALQQGWFRYIWAFYFVTLVVVLLRSYNKKARLLHRAFSRKP